MLDVEWANQLETPFSFLREIGKGKFGAVYEGENRQTGERRALKVVQKTSKVGAAERTVMNALPDHPNVIGMESCFEIGEDLCVFVLELCQTDLKCYMDERGGKLEEEDVRLLMKGISQGLAALQEKGIFHRDLKTENIFLQIKDDGEVVPKLGDFGLARILRRPNELFYSYTGSPLYFAPEIWSQTGYTTKADLYSCGVMLYEMITGNPPFSFSRNKLQLRRLALYSGIPSTEFDALPLDDDGKHLMRGLLERDFKKRIEWEEFFTHPWLASSCVDDLGLEMGELSLHERPHKGIASSFPML